MNTSAKWKFAVWPLGLGLLGTEKAMAANAVDGTITVTPVAAVSLALAPTTYAFGSVGVAISTVSISSITLSNVGSVAATVDKQIQTQSAPAGWTAGNSAGADTYVLYVATSTFQPNPGDFITAAHRFGAQANVTNLNGLGGNQPTLAPADVADLWFRLDMPTTVTTQAARTITVRFTGTAN
jgi:hypothetical protein